MKNGPHKFIGFTTYSTVDGTIWEKLVGETCQIRCVN